MTRKTRLQKITRNAALIAAALLGAASFSTARPASAQELHCETGPCHTEPAEGWIRGPEGPVFARYERVEGVAVLQGDILVEELPRVGRAAIVTGGIQTWAGGVMPYVIDPALPNPERVLAAIDQINSQTTLRVVPRTNEPDYVEFVPASGCSSYIGRVGGAQPINLALGCVAPQTVHEILHAAGFYHEQSRTDRDLYVDVLLQNVEPGREFNFDVFVAGRGLNHGPYDYASIMHYGTHFFSATGLPTLVATQPLPPGVVLGGGSGLSVGDIAGITALYGGTPPAPTAATPLANGVPTGPLAGAAGSELRFVLTVPQTATSLDFALAGGSGDADLLVAFGRTPSANDFDCRPFLTGNNETCGFAAPAAGTWHVLVQGFSDFADATLVGTYVAGSPAPGALQPISAQKLKFKQDAVSSAKNRLSLKSTDLGATAPVAGTPMDPAQFGARLVLSNPARGEQGAIVLPANGWARKANGTLKYSDGRCSVTLKPAGKLKVRCARISSGFTLDEFAQGSLTVGLELGTGGGLCTRASAPTRDFGFGATPNNPTKGLFSAANAPAPASCGL